MEWLIITLYVILGILYNNWVFNKNIEKYRWLVSQSTELYTLYKLIVLLIFIVIFVLFSPIFIMIIALNSITSYLKRRKLTKQVSRLEKALNK